MSSKQTPNKRTKQYSLLHCKRYYFQML